MSERDVHDARVSFVRAATDSGLTPKQADRLWRMSQPPYPTAWAAIINDESP